MSKVDNIFQKSLFYDLYIIYMSDIKIEREKMKRIRKTQRKTTKYCFLLKKKNNEEQFEQIYADFNAISQHKKSEIKQFYPYFLRDNNYWTPAFIFPILGFYKPQGSNLISKQQPETLQNEENQKLIVQPEPDPFNKICYVCLRKFDQYFSHVQSETHKLHLKNSIYQKYIKSFCSEKYGNQNQQPKIKPPCPLPSTEIIQIQ